MMTTTILDCFDKLYSENENERTSNGVLLLRYLSQQNSIYNENKELKYALNRLIRSLGSSRAIARKSSYATLTAYLSLNDNVTVDDIIAIMESELHPTKNTPKSENADIYLGRILTCGALIRSNIMKNDSVEKYKKLAECLIQAGKQRNYLSYCSTAFITEILNQVNEKTFKESLWPTLEKEVFKPWEDQTLNTFYILFLIRDKFPNTVNISELKKSFGSAKIISEKNLSNIFKLLIETPTILCSNHPVYKIFCEKLAETGLLMQFWEKIDTRFEKPSKSDEILGVKILKYLVDNVHEKSLIPSLITPNLLQYIIKRCMFHKRNQKDLIAKDFKNILMHIITIVEKNAEPKICFTLLKKFILYPGDLMIEKKVGLKIINRIMSCLDEEGIVKLSKIYRSIVENTKPKKRPDSNLEPWTNAERIYAAQLIIKLLGHPSMITNNNWRLEHIKLFFELGFCESSNIGVDLAVHFKDSFYRAMDQKLSKLSDIRSILGQLISHLDSELFTKKTLILKNPLNETATANWKMMIKQVSKLENKTQNIAVIFHTMNLFMGLQLFSDTEMAVTSINELHICYNKINKKTTEEIDEPQWVEVVVDLLLSLLSRKNHLLRSMVHCVFPHICSYLTVEAVHQILEVFDVQNEKSPLQNKYDEKEDESSDMEFDSDSDRDDESDQNNTEDESDSDFEDNFEGGEDEAVTDKLRMAVHQALGEAVMQTDNEDIDVDQIGEEEGRQLNESLAAAFKILRENRKSESKKQGKAAEMLTHFRTRVIDLLEIYLDHSPTMALTLDMLVPLLTLLEYCIKDHHQKPLEIRVRACLKKLSNIKKFNNIEGVNEQILLDILKTIMEKGERSTTIYHVMGDKLAECCTFLVKCLQQIENSTNSIVKLFCENLHAYFKRSILPASLFRNILQICWEGNWQIASLLVNYAFDNNIRSFRRSQALEFLTCFYRNDRLFQLCNTQHKKLLKEIEEKLYMNTLIVLQELNAKQKSSNIKTEKDVKQKSTTVNSEKDVKQKFICLLFTLLKHVYPKHIPECWNWSKISEAMVEYRANISFSNDTKVAYNKLVAVIKPSTDVISQKIISMNGNSINTNTEGIQSLSEIVKTGKLPEQVKKINDTSQTSSDNENKTKLTKKELKKKKKNLSKQKDRQKLKKETRELRAKAMSEGLENVTFSSVTFSNGEDVQSVMENGDMANDDSSNVQLQKRKAEVCELKTKKKKKKLIRNI